LVKPPENTPLTYTWLLIILDFTLFY